MASRPPKPHSPSEVEVTAGPHRIRISNPHKVLYPATGFTKCDVVNYYADVADALLPHLRNRPLTLKRYPNGVDATFFYEKRCPSHRPEWVETASVFVESRGEEVSFCLANDQATLVWLANLADLELHTALAQAPKLDQPTVLVFDLDPGAGVGLRECAIVARLIREQLTHAGLDCFAKTSGSKGLQLYAPLNTGHVTFDQTKALARTVGDALASAYPEAITTSMSKATRRGRIFIDWSQNAPSKTTVCVYSLRATPEPGVSTPLEWHEVESVAEGADEQTLRFSPAQVLERVRGHGDLFAPVLHQQQRLPA